MANLLRNFLSYVIISIFSLALSTAIFSFDLKDTFLNSHTLKQVLSDGKVYDGLVRDFLPSFLSDQISKDKENPPVPLSLLKDIVAKTIPPSSIQADTEKVIDSLVPYLNGKTEKLNVTIDLSAYKKRFNDSLRPTLTEYLVGLPKCSPENEPTDLEKIPSCSSQKQTPDQIVQQLPIVDLESALQSLPNSVLINETGFDFQPKDSQTNSDQENKFNLENVRKALSLLNLFILGALLVSLTSLILLLLVWIGHFRQGLQKLSFAFFSTAVLPAVAGVLLLATSNQELWSRINVRLSNQLTKPFTDHLGFLLIFQAVSLVLIGAAILAFVKLLSRKDNRKIFKGESKEG